MKKLVLFLLTPLLALPAFGQAYDLGGGTHFLLYEGNIFSTPYTPVATTSALPVAYSFQGSVHYPLLLLGDKASVNAQSGLMLYANFHDGLLGAQIPLYLNFRAGAYSNNYNMDGAAFGLGAGVTMNGLLLSAPYFSDATKFIMPSGMFEIGHQDWRLRLYASVGAYQHRLSQFPNDPSTVTYYTTFGGSLVYSFPIDEWEK
jgi:hypothetical protein